MLISGCRGSIILIVVTNLDGSWTFDRDINLPIHDCFIMCRAIKLLFYINTETQATVGCVILHILNKSCDFRLKKKSLGILKI